MLEVLSLCSGEGSTSFRKNNCAHFSVKKKKSTEKTGYSKTHKMAINRPADLWERRNTHFKEGKPFFKIEILPYS